MMANVKIGNTPSWSGQTVEKITEAKQLTRSDSGKLFFVEQGSGTYVINLPELSTDIAGWQAQFVLSVLGDSVEINGYGVEAGGGTSGDNDVMRYQERTNSNITTADVDGISFGVSASTIGAKIDIYTDGTYWYAYGYGVIAADFVAVDA